MEVKLPKLGESLFEATIVQWLKKEGDAVKEDEALLEVTTDKVNSEIPSPASGILKKIIADVDAMVSVGDVLCVIESDDDNKQEEVIKEVNKDDQIKAESNKKFLSPAILRIAEEKGISVDELQNVEGSGAEGRITRKDLENYLSKKQNDESGGERIKMSAMRKAIAENMTKSFYSAPHASLVVEVDVTDAMEFVAKAKASFYEKHNAKLTITSIVIQAIAKAAKKYSLLNSCLEDDSIVVHKDVNVGIAVNVEKGLLVPVIRQSNDMQLSDIAKSLGELATKARSGSITREDVEHGTITFTNFGMGGAMFGIPIIRYPEVAIIGMGAIQKRPVVNADGSVVVRKVACFSLAFDHRVVDGIYASEFVKEIKNFIETQVVC